MGCSANAPAIFLPTNEFHYFIPGLGRGGVCWLVACVLSSKFGKGQRSHILVFLAVDLC